MFDFAHSSHGSLQQTVSVEPTFVRHTSFMSGLSLTGVTQESSAYQKTTQLDPTGSGSPPSQVFQGVADQSLSSNPETLRSVPCTSSFSVIFRILMEHSIAASPSRQEEVERRGMDFDTFNRPWQLLYRRTCYFGRPYASNV